MPKQMPRFDLRLAAVAQTATGITKAGEFARSSTQISVQKEWTITRLEALYELAYLRVFAAWENCLEAIFYRSLCGFQLTTGRAVLLAGRPYFSSIAAAEGAVMGTRQYLLWHNPNHIVSRCQGFISAGIEERIINSNIARLQYLAHTRHRIVHDQADAKRNFDAATRNLVGHTYPASRPGKFLRDWDTSVTPAQRWLETITSELTGLTRQMV
jgi:hypothetical protein